MIENDLLSFDTGTHSKEIEEWVRETLLMAMPEGIVDHRAPEVLAAVHGAPLTHKGISEAFWSPLDLFVRQYSPGHDAIRERLIERIEDTIAKDDRPYVGEWIAQQWAIRWKWKYRAEHVRCGLLSFRRVHGLCLDPYLFRQWIFIS